MPVGMREVEEYIPQKTIPSEQGLKRRDDPLYPTGLDASEDDSNRTRIETPCHDAVVRVDLFLRRPFQ